LRARAFPAWRFAITLTTRPTPPSQCVLSRPLADGNLLRHHTHWVRPGSRRRLDTTSIPDPIRCRGGSRAHATQLRPLRCRSFRLLASSDLGRSGRRTPTLHYLRAAQQECATPPAPECGPHPDNRRTTSAAGNSDALAFARRRARLPAPPCLRPRWHGLISLQGISPTYQRTRSFARLMS
jgi:hypothetical protein